MKKRLPVLLAAALLALAACGTAGVGQRTAPEETGYQIFFPVALGAEAGDNQITGPTLKGETRYTTGADVANWLVECLLAGPQSPGLSSPYPAGVRQIAPPVIEDGVCRVNLSEQYGSLSELKLTIADYCIALTLCQLEDIEAVTIDVEGEAIPYRDHQLLAEGDVLLSSAEDEPVYLHAALYYLSADGAGLRVEQREVLVGEQETTVSAVMNALLAGPEDASLTLPMPEGASLLAVWVENGVCYLNFDAPFLTTPPPQPQARLLLYAMVDTMCALPDVDAVHLLVEGQSLPEYGGVPTASPLEAEGEQISPARAHLPIDNPQVQAVG